jgi:hypothetical protein
VNIGERDLTLSAYQRRQEAFPVKSLILPIVQVSTYLFEEWGGKKPEMRIALFFPGYREKNDTIIRTTWDTRISSFYSRTAANLFAVRQGTVWLQGDI